MRLLAATMGQKSRKGAECLTRLQSGTEIAFAWAKNHNDFNERGIHNKLEMQRLPKTYPVHKPYETRGIGAGEGNRTLVCSLGSCRSTIELRPRVASHD